MGRVTEWSMVVRDNCRNVYMVAEAQYARGARPTETEIDALDKCIKTKYSKAEFAAMRRSIIPSQKCEAVRVMWALEWIVYED